MNEPPPDEHAVTLARVTLPPTTPLADEIGLYLVVVEGADRGRHLRLSGAPVTIGRDPTRDLVLNDPGVSRLHVQISVQNGQVLVEDRQSTNGTFIDGKRLAGTALLGEGGRLQLGRHALKLERRSQRDVWQNEELERDLERARRYVQSLLPAPLVDGAVTTDWLFLPSARLGGDAFGYEQVESDLFVFYLFDVSGHGVGAAMHSVSVLNILRQRAVPGADIREPAQVLAGLNAMFEMDRHDGMYFTLWYGVYHAGQRLLRYASAGHHPGYLVPADRRGARPLKTRGPMIGATASARFTSEETPVLKGASLYLFSDGVFEIVAGDGRRWQLGDFVAVLSNPRIEGRAESVRLHEAVMAAARPGPLEDDFSLLVVTFP